MKRALLVAPSKIVLEVVDDPTPGSDELLVEVKAAGICGSDIAIQRGPFAGRLTLPRVLGHEWSGQVVSIGKEVTNFKPGDHVVSEEIFWCGMCSQCRAGHFDYCEDPEELGFTVDGAFATHILLPARYCHKLPENISFEAGAMIEPLSVAYNALYLAGDGVEVGQRVAVIGMGPIGLCISLWAKASGATVIGIEPRSFRRSLAADLGVSELICVVPDSGILDIPLNALGKIDILVEASGVQSMIPLVLPTVRPKGRVILVGHSAHPVEIPLEILVLRDIKMVGSCGQVGLNTYAKVIRALSQDLIDPTKMITHRFVLDQIIEAFEFALKSEKYGKIMFVQ